MKVVAIDVDGDGDVDALAASRSDDTVAWYENDGSQSFTEFIITTIVDDPAPVFSIDVDGDGDVDALSASYEDDTVAWYENDGSRSFTRRVITDSANNARSVFAIDVDGDGDVDALSASISDQTFAWYENGCETASPTPSPADAESGPPPRPTFNCASVSFAERIITTLAGWAYSVFAIDVDGDGDVDALSASYGDTRRVVRERWDRVLHRARHHKLGGRRLLRLRARRRRRRRRRRALASGDDNTVAWHENDGSESFTERIITDSAYLAWSVFAVDVDGDGDVDALSVSANDDTVAWYENDGSQSFAERVITALADNARSVYAIDVDGDGDVDALSASGNDDTVAWYENDGSQSFTERVITTLADYANAVFAIDVDGDGDVDALSASGDDIVAWYENDGSQSFTERVVGTPDDPRSVFAIDVDGDGDVDALASSANDDTVAWYENDCGTHAPSASPTATRAPTRPVPAPPRPTVRCASAALIAEPHVWSDTGGQVTGVHAIDVDGDGDEDIVASVLHADTVAWYDSGGRVIAADFVGAKSARAIDVDGDFDVDVLAASGVADAVAWFENDGSQSFTKHVIANSPDHPASVCAIDVDGDGDVDALSALLDDTVAWYENDGSQSFAGASSRTRRTPLPFAIDVDGDGDVDALASSANDDTVAWFENDGSRLRVVTAQVLDETAVVHLSAIFAEDVDGDGDVDVAVGTHEGLVAVFENACELPPPTAAPSSPPSPAPSSPPSPAPTTAAPSSAPSTTALALDVADGVLAATAVGALTDNISGAVLRTMSDVLRTRRTLAATATRRRRARDELLHQAGAFLAANGSVTVSSPAIVVSVQVAAAGEPAAVRVADGYAVALPGEALAATPRDGAGALYASGAYFLLLLFSVQFYLVVGYYAVCEGDRQLSAARRRGGRAGGRGVPAVPAGMVALSLSLLAGLRAAYFLRAVAFTARDRVACLELADAAMHAPTTRHARCSWPCRRARRAAQAACGDAPADDGSGAVAGALAAAGAAATDLGPRAAFYLFHVAMRIAEVVVVGVTCRQSLGPATTPRESDDFFPLTWARLLRFSDVRHSADDGKHAFRLSDLVLPPEPAGSDGVELGEVANPLPGRGEPFDEGDVYGAREEQPVVIVNPTAPRAGATRARPGDEGDAAARRTTTSSSSPIPRRGTRRTRTTARTSATRATHGGDEKEDVVVVDNPLRGTPGGDDDVDVDLGDVYDDPGDAVAGASSLARESHANA
ncbi:hypothetical protein JL720_317 [Aureococcus anophagefferens]|nr:hypothetical protein JL720_317 [Aureococcus anophagefferens]